MLFRSRAPLPVPAFEMALAGIGVFPPRGRPRACWLGVDPGGDAVRRVARAVHDRLRAAGLPEAADEFHPHVTLARVRRPGSLRAATLRLAAPAAPSPAMRVDAITLFESRLVPPPVTYVPVARVPLSA